MKIEEYENCNLFSDNLSDRDKFNVKIEFLTLEDMLTEIFNKKADTTIQATEIGRFMQLIKASDLKIEK